MMEPRSSQLDPIAIVGDRVFTEIVDVTSDLGALDATGTWVVFAPASGSPTCARFAHVTHTTRPFRGAPMWPGIPDAAIWETSLTKHEFCGGVQSIRERIAAGDVYQVNLTRRLQTKLPHDADILALAGVLADGNPAPYAGVLRLHDIQIACASPELFVSRNGRVVRSSPIKGTASSSEGFLEKDFAENVMIVDLVRNDFGRVCEWGSVMVPDLCIVEEHPGLAHLVSTVEGTLRNDVGWPELLDAAFPPGSVTGAPKIAALAIIDELEPVERGPYCGAFGWVDADQQMGEIAVTIRTFWFADGHLCFGTGGGITWGSDPLGEWDETELKAAHLLAVASRAGQGS